MRSIKIVLNSAALIFFLATALAQAATLTGTVTDKTTGKPAAGDPVVLVDVQAGMSEVAHATTDGQGHYSLSAPGSGPYLIRVTHQGAGYFIAAPQGGAPGDIPVYDVAAKVEGVFIEADVFEIETENGQLRVTERYFVHNTSMPPRTEWSPRTFEIVLPPEATVAGVAAQRPTGLPTSVKLDPTGAKGHYAFNFPIQPDEGDKNTLFQVEYHPPLQRRQIHLPSKRDVAYPEHRRSAAQEHDLRGRLRIDFSIRARRSQCSDLRRQECRSRQDARVHHLRQRLHAPRDNKPTTEARRRQRPPGNQPGGGIGVPINTPDPLSKYKWWILGGLALLLATAAAFLLRKPMPAVAGGGPVGPAIYEPGTVGAPVYAAPSTPAAKNTALLNVLKEELFALESEKLSGTLAPAEYAETKAALEIVLKRALKHSA